MFALEITPKIIQPNVVSATLLPQYDTIWLRHIWVDAAKGFFKCWTVAKKPRKNTNSDSFIHKHLCGFGKGTKCFKFMAYHATRKFRKVAIKTKLNVVSKQPSHFHHLLYINGLPGSLFSYISYHEDLQSVSKSRAYTMSFLYVHKIRRKTEWWKSPLLNWILFSAPLSVVVSKLRMWFSREY